jgi:hypothetical protein
MTRGRDPADLTKRGSVEVELHRLDDKGLADIGLARSDWRKGSLSLFTVQLGQKQSVLSTGSYRGLASTVGAALLLVLALLSAEKRPTDHVALLSCPLFHPGIMGSVSSSDTVPTSSWAHCEIRAR